MTKQNDNFLVVTLTTTTTTTNGFTCQDGNEVGHIHEDRLGGFGIFWKNRRKFDSLKSSGRRCSKDCLIRLSEKNHFNNYGNNTWTKFTYNATHLRVKNTHEWFDEDSNRDRTERGFFALAAKAVVHEIETWNEADA